MGLGDGANLRQDERGLGLEWPWGRYRDGMGEREVEQHGGYILVNGGATATGALAVQLLRL